jgi:hypothetical protein
VIPSHHVKHELCQLLWKISDGSSLPEDVDRLEQLTSEDPEIQALAAEFAALYGMLHWTRRGPPRPNITPNAKDGSAFQHPPAAIFIARAGDDATGFFSSGWPVAYVVAIVVLGIALVVGALVPVTRPAPLADPFPSTAKSQPSPELKTPFVGQITGVADCRWTDPKARISDGDYVRLGQEYALVSGYLEITYQSGAKVILEGPVRYVVESQTGGFLAIGKLTARVEKKGSVSGAQDSGSKGERTANPTLSLAEREPVISLAPRPSPLAAAGSRPSSLDSRLFSVRTPTAIVTDLGTEFGVEVDRSGATRSHVFQGKVKVELANGGNDAEALIVGEMEETTVEAGRNRTVKVIRGTGQSPAPTGFVRRMPSWVPIKVFGTGAGLKEGERDPHWQIVARSDNPRFQPQAAVVATAVPVYLSNESSRSQWISTDGSLPGMPGGLYTFRTTFELGDALPESAVLQGRFIADNHVDAIRLNGRAVPVLPHSGTAPFVEFHSFKIVNGFVRGTNVLEIVVYNNPAIQTIGQRPSGAPMALRVELKAFGLRASRVPVAIDDKHQR